MWSMSPRAQLFLLEGGGGNLWAAHYLSVYREDQHCIENLPGVQPQLHYRFLGQRAVGGDMTSLPAGKTTMVVLLSLSFTMH